MPSHHPLLFVHDAYEYMANELIKTTNFTRGEYSLKRFSNNELYITLQTQVKDKECFILGSLSPPDTNLFSFLLLCHTIKKEKARKITAVLPYLAYSRHDKDEPYKSYAMALIGKLLDQTGIDNIITFDIHSSMANILFPMPLVSLFPAQLFANEILSQSMQNATIIAPDKGAIERCRAVAKQAGMMRDIAYMEKKRTEQGVTHSQFYGEVGDYAIIIDDILDTGGTLVSCCQQLSSLGVKNILIMVTHGLFTGNKWEQLWKLGVNRIYCTNTLPLNLTNTSSIIVLSIIPQLSDYLSKHS
jgi:ribose-phosphate pyrophosphokinase